MFPWHAFSSIALPTVCWEEAAAICRLKINGEKYACCSGGFFLHSVHIVYVFSVPAVGHVCIPGNGWQLNCSSAFSGDRSMVKSNSRCVEVLLFWLLSSGEYI